MRFEAVKLGQCGAFVVEQMRAVHSQLDELLGDFAPGFELGLSVLQFALEAGGNLDGNDGAVVQGGAGGAWRVGPGDWRFEI